MVMEMNIIEASYNGDLKLVKKLIAEGADVNAKDYDGDAPLYFARDSDVIEYLKKQVAIE
jgi:ankyrin repeat protein